MIKYGNGTLLKTVAGDYYLMAFGLSRLIPDERTLKNLDIDKTKAITISLADLASIPAGESIPHFEYPIGTILKESESTKEEYYLITEASQKKLIPDKATLEKMGLDSERVQKVAAAKLKAIADDPEPLPHLYYQDGSILKCGNKYYYTSMDKKIEVPDEDSLKVQGLDVQMQTITIRAKGTESGGSFPLIQLRVDGQVVKEWFMTGQYRDYSATIPLGNGKHEIDVVYLNDQEISTKIKSRSKTYWHRWRIKTRIEQWTEHNVTADRTLWVDYLRVGKKKIEAEDGVNVRYDRGISQDIGSTMDGQDVVAGQEQLNTAGALRFKVDIDNTQRVKAEELKRITDLQTAKIVNGELVLERVVLPRVAYANNTLLKSDDGQLWLMDGGVRRKVPDEATLEALGMSKKEAKIMVDEVPEGKPLSPIKYANGTVLEDLEGNRYLMQAGMRMLIPDQTTFEAMGFNQKASIKLSDYELGKISEGGNLPTIKYANNTLVKGSGDAVYLMMGGQKKYLPWGDSNILNSYRQQGIKVDNITKISDEELSSLPTADGVKKIDFYNSETKSKSIWGTLANIVIPFIPGIGQIYMVGMGIYNMAKGNFAQGALSFLGGLGSLSALAKAGDLANLGKVGQQIGNLATSINKAKTISGLTNLANSFNKINQFSIAAFGNDLSDGSGRKIQGVNRFLAGLSYVSSGSIKIPGLNLESVKYLATTYKLGVSITGKQNIIGGKRIGDEERFNLGASALAPYIGQSFASAKDANRLGFNPGSILNVGRDIFAAGQLAFQYASNAYNAAGKWVTDPGTLVRDIGVMGKEIGKGAYEAAKGGVKESRQGLSYAASLVKDGLSDFNKAINYVARNEAIGKVVDGLVMGSVNRLVREVTGRDPGLSIDELNKIPGVKQFMEKANTASQRLSFVS